jgi:hypothetical protein
MIRVERDNSYKTFYWPSKGEVYDTERHEKLIIKIFGLTIYKRNREFNAEYFEKNTNIGYKSINENNRT